jgi:hypothetical protein
MRRDILLVLLGVLIGTLIGYFGESILNPYVEPYSFASTLTLTTDVNATTITLGETVMFKAQLDTTIPAELSALEQPLREFLLNNKPVTLMLQYQNSTYWSIVETKNTIYTINGEATFSYTFLESGTYSFKAVFEGDNALKASESQIITFTVA